MKHTLTTIIGLIIISIQSACLYEPPTKPKFQVWDNFEVAKSAAMTNQKPILVIFNGTNRAVDPLGMMKLPDITALIEANYNVVDLYVDDKDPLPMDSNFVNRNNRRIKTYGQYNGNLQRQLMPEYFQPMYALLDKSGKPITTKTGKHFFYMGYVSPDDPEEVSAFKKMLEDGLKLL